jgi:membrane protease YdiL (CAAX protease family)
LLAPGLALLCSLIVDWQKFLVGDSEQYLKELQNFLIPHGPYAWIGYITVALAPGICEELMFRGALLGLLRKTLSPAVSVAIVAVLFGMLHGSSARFLPTALMGLVLGGLTQYCGSIFQR